MADITIDADARAALAEFEKLVDAQRRLSDEQRKGVEGSKEAAAEERRLGRLRDRLIRENETAQERYVRKLAEAKSALDGVEGEEEQLGRARKRLSQEYLRALEKQNQKVSEVGETSREAFDAEGLASYVAGLGASLGAAESLRQVLVQVRQETAEAARDLQQLAPARGQLLQLAGDDPVKRRRLAATADEIFASGFVATRDQAERVTFELDSAGRLDELKFFSALNVIDDSASLARSARLISTGFRGTGESVGTGADIASKSLAAASTVTGVSSSQIAEAVAGVSAAARPFGLSDEELFAAISLVSEGTGSASEASTQIRSLLSQLTRRGLADELSGQGFSTILRAVGGLVSSKQERIEFLGGSEAARAFAPLEDTGLLRRRIGEIDAAQRNNLATRTIRNALGDEVVRSNIALQRANAAVTLSRDRAGINRTFADADAARSRGEFDSQFGPVGGAIVSGINGLVRLLPGVDENLAARERSEINNDLNRTMREVAKETRKQTRVIQQGVVPTK